MTSPSDHFANERTFLAWVRTGIALIGFGFVIAKFAIFIDLIKGQKAVGGPSVTYGEIMIILGGFVIAYGIYNYLRNEKDLEKGTYTPKVVENTLFATIILIIALTLALLILI